MAARDITFIECPFGDSFPVRRTAKRSFGVQKIVCPHCSYKFDVLMEESIERLSQEAPALQHASVAAV